MASSFAQLLGRMQELRDLGGLSGLATWDQETYLPAKADGARAAQLGTLQGLMHERLVDPQVGDWLDAAAGEPLSDDQRAMLRVLKIERDRAVKVPGALVKALAEAQGVGVSAWRQARKEKRFQTFAPALTRLLEIRREQADAIGHDGQRYNALLEAYEPGMTVQRLTPVLQSLAQKLRPLVEQLASRPAAPDVLAGKRFDPEQQWAFTMRLLDAVGFDLAAGRQDKSVHPFTGGTHPLDVRLTTKIVEDDPTVAIFGTIHEAGHGLYEQGFHPDHYRTPLAAAPSMGLHESQSRLWENIVGRSRAFWTHFYPPLRELFSTQLWEVSQEQFLATVNQVRPSLIRTEADEVTYNLHIVLRYELELKLISGELAVADLPEAWNAKMQSLLGITPADDVEGVLQDIHWSWGEFGYFPTYALGNLYAASLWARAQAEIDGLETRISRGELGPLRDWLRDKVHHQGYRYPAEELVTRVTGRGLTDEDFLAYLKRKYEL